MESSNLRHCQPLTEQRTEPYQRRVSWLQTGPSPARGREAGEGQPELERGNLSPRDGILYQTVSKLPVANRNLGFWMVDICRQGRSQRSAPQRRHTHT